MTAEQWGYEAEAARSYANAIQAKWGLHAIVIGQHCASGVHVIAAIADGRPIGIVGRPVRVRRPTGRMARTPCTARRDGVTEGRRNRIRCDHIVIARIEFSRLRRELPSRSQRAGRYFGTGALACGVVTEMSNRGRSALNVRP